MESENPKMTTILKRVDFLIIGGLVLLLGNCSSRQQIQQLEAVQVALTKLESETTLLRKEVALLKAESSKTESKNEVQ